MHVPESQTGAVDDPAQLDTLPHLHSPPTHVSPELEQAIVKDIEEEVKAKKYAELKEAVTSFSSNLSKFFAHYKLSPNEKWYESNPYLGLARI